MILAPPHDRITINKTIPQLQVLIGYDIIKHTGSPSNKMNVSTVFTSESVKNLLVGKVMYFLFSGQKNLKESGRNLKTGQDFFLETLPKKN